MDSSEKINEMRVCGVKYVILLLTALVLAGCSDASEKAEEQSNNNSVTNASVSFRNVDVKTESNQVFLTGEVRATEGEFFYTVEQGGAELIDENHMEVEEEPHGWSGFSLEITLPDGTAADAEAPVVTLYGKNKDGKAINPNYVPIDLDMEEAS